MSEPFRVWITKWCLSSGIEEATALEFPGAREWCVVQTGRLKNYVLQSGQWHRTNADAIKEAKAVLARAIKSQRDRLEELESVVFNEGESNEGTSERAGEGATGDETGAQRQHEPAF